jgi:hypothetical protein
MLPKFPVHRETMAPRDRIVAGVRELLEQQYLGSVGGRAQEEYAALDHSEQRVVLKAFLQKLLARSESDQWAKVLQNILNSDAACPSN